MNPSGLVEVLGSSTAMMMSPAAAAAAAASAAANSGGQNNQMMAVMPQQQQQQPQVSLNLLIEFLVQRIYHELVVELAELMPRKTDMERKVSIFQFASRTRMMLVRLLALVKWASSASKVDKCNKIMDFLDRQSMLFTDTADSLAQMARETLVRATLPNFHLPAAVEVLTTGYYSRIPKCVRDRIVPAKPITALERKQTLLRLNQVKRFFLISLPNF
jgi:mediator of RNA polymerase II transcription subunit 14